jgi:hypothetical protein
MPYALLLTGIPTTCPSVIDPSISEPSFQRKTWQPPRFALPCPALFLPRYLTCGGCGLLRPQMRRGKASFIALVPISSSPRKIQRPRWPPKPIRRFGIGNGCSNSPHPFIMIKSSRGGKLGGGYLIRETTRAGAPWLLCALVWWYFCIHGAFSEIHVFVQLV